MLFQVYSKNLCFPFFSWSFLLSFILDSGFFKLHYTKLNISADINLMTVTLTYCTLVVYTT